MSASIPPIVRTAETLLASIEQAVVGFPRKHRYSVGEEIRTAARVVVRGTTQAWRDVERRAALLKQLVVDMDNLKLELQLGQRLHAYKSLGQFEALMRVARELGRQIGGWNLRQHPNGQNAAATGQQQRPKILSTPAASRYEANR